MFLSILICIKLFILILKLNKEFDDSRNENESIALFVITLNWLSTIYSKKNANETVENQTKINSIPLPVVENTVEIKYVVLISEIPFTVRANT